MSCIREKASRIQARGDELVFVHSNVAECARSRGAASETQQALKATESKTAHLHTGYRFLRVWDIR